MGYPSYDRSTSGRRITVICGSMRFEEDMRAAAVTESLAGRIVVMPNVNMKHPDDRWADPANAELIKADLDVMHRDKIRLADEVLVVTRDGYIGDSTRSEIGFARSIGCPVRYVDFHDYEAEVSA